MAFTREQRITFAETALKEGRISQHLWRSYHKEDGREIVCALSAFGPDIQCSNHCPADFMPQWLAHEIPSLDDMIHPTQIPFLAGGLIARAKLWHTLSQDAWERIEHQYQRCYGRLPSADNRQLAEEKYLTLTKRLFSLIDEELEALNASQ